MAESTCNLLVGTVGATLSLEVVIQFMCQNTYQDFLDCQGTTVMWLSLRTQHMLAKRGSTLILT